MVAFVKQMLALYRVSEVLTNEADLLNIESTQ